MPTVPPTSSARCSSRKPSASPWHRRREKGASMTDRTTQFGIGTWARFRASWVEARELRAEAKAAWRQLATAPGHHLRLQRAGLCRHELVDGDGSVLGTLRCTPRDWLVRRRRIRIGDQYFTQQLEWHVTSDVGKVFDSTDSRVLSSS